MKKKNYINITIKTFLILICSITLGTLLLIGSYLLPVEPMIKNAQDVKTVFQEEGMYPVLIKGYYNTMLDNFSDSIILNQAIYKGNENVIHKAMYVYRTNKYNPVYDVIHTIKNDEELERTDYSRYWHGDMIILKPLLLLFSYSQIRIINTFIQSILLFLIIYFMIKRNLFCKIPDLLICILFIFPFFIGKSLQYSNVYNIFLISTLIMLVFNEKLKNKYIYFFMIVGALTSYFDLLSFPILGLGMPLLFNILLNRKETLKENILDIIKYSLFWGIGYAGMWVGKWIIGSILCNDNLFEVALDKVKYRSSSGSTNRIDPVIKNLKIYFNKTYLIILTPILCYHLYCIIRNIKKITKKVLIGCIPYLIIFLIPIMWYIVMSNHSEIHFWFTNKSLIVSIYSLLLMLHHLHDKNKLNEN